MRKLLALLCGAVLAFVSAGTVGAITYGELDGQSHPNVGALVAKWRGDRTQLEILCSGTLIAPTVYLTAAHCTAFLESLRISDVWVTFDSEFDSRSRLLHGRMHTHPDFATSAANDPADVAVVVLDKPVRGIEPARLPTARLLDQLNANGGLDGQKFTAVGYGSHQMQIGGGPWTFPFFGVRERAVSEFRALNAAWLRLSQNAATGDSGTCYGDSGGPNFLGAGAGETNIIAGLTVTGDFPCYATNETGRLDTTTARSFLGRFVDLP
jgi:hypothetical protein